MPTPNGYAFFMHILPERKLTVTNHIALFEPLMPANTGNIARTCAGTNTELHLIEPLGFSTDDKHMKRAGLDYWDKVKITYHKNLREFIDSIPDLNNLFIVSKLLNEHTLKLTILIQLRITISFSARKRQAYLNNLCGGIQKNVSVFRKMITTSER